MKNLYVIVLIAFAISSLTAQRTTTGRVIRVIDGDTYVIQAASYKGVKDVPLTVRLVNVDCPEIYFVAKKRPAQPFGDHVKNLMTQLISGKDLELTFQGRDNYNRVLAFIKIEGTRLDDIVLQNGWGWVFRKYQTSKKEYKRGKAMQDKAKLFKTGLWLDPDAMAPDEWRKLPPDFFEPGIN